MFIGVAILVISVIFSYYTLQDGTKNGLADVIGKNFIYGLTSLIGQGRNGQYFHARGASIFTHLS